eukprot:gene821-988_t
MKQDQAYLNFCKGFLKGAAAPKEKPQTQLEKEDEHLDKLISALDEMGKTKQEDDDLLKRLRESCGDPLEDARKRAEGPEFIDLDKLEDYDLDLDKF